MKNLSCYPQDFACLADISTVQADRNMGKSGMPAGLAKGSQAGLVTYRLYQYPSPIGESTWKLRFTTKAGRSHKTHRQGPVLPASASATTKTSDHHDGRRRSPRKRPLQLRKCRCLRLVHFSSAAGLLTSHG
jgi:hypothetical protein